MIRPGKTDKQLQKETLMQEKQDTPANFGRHYSKWCICEVEGQVPCPGTVDLPKSMLAKVQYKMGLFNKKEWTTHQMDSNEGHGR